MSVRHLDEEQVQRLLHGELAPSVSASVRDHIDVCDECRSRVDESAREETTVRALMENLDHTPPLVDVRTVKRRTQPAFALGRWAAGVLLLLAIGGVAYAAPGLPFRAVVERLITRVGGRDTPRDGQARPEIALPPSSRDVVQGLAVLPGDRFRIVFSSPEPGAIATLSLTDGPQVAIRAVGGRATFTSDVDRVTIGDVTGGSRFEIDVPRGAPRVEIWIAGRRVFSKSASGVVTEGQPDAGGAYRLPLSSPLGRE